MTVAEKPIYMSRSQAHLSVDIEFQSSSRCVESRNFRNIVVLAFTLFFLKFEGDTGNGSALDTLHQMGGETGNFVAQTF